MCRIINESSVRYMRHLNETADTEFYSRKIQYLIQREGPVSKEKT